MDSRQVILDVGDVLIRTAPMAHYRALAGRVGAPWQAVAAIVEESGVIDAFETGRLSGEEFTDKIAGHLGHPDLRHGDLEDAWCAVIGPTNLPVAEAAAALAASGRLMLASNTNPFHWRVIRSRLAGLGIDCPTYLSFEIGAAKPAQAFFAALTADSSPVAAGSIYIDDRAGHVAAAAHNGLAAWQHRDSARTAGLLASLLR
jgi:FMN phosphatase YigB (HAD superfamily)